MQFDLSEEDAEVLREVLDFVIRDLSPEISHTDNASYRRELVAKREHLRAVLDQIGGPLAVEERQFV